MSYYFSQFIGVQGPLIMWFFIFTFLVLRYTIIGGLAFMLFYKVFGNSIAYKKIQRKWPNKEDYKREIKYSMLTFLIFATLSLVIFNPIYGLEPNLYANIADHGWGYYIFTLVVMMLLHDTYFYWMHRAIHHPKLYKAFHKVHHESTNPTPWAAFSFHPLEAVLEFSIILVFLLTFPVHRSAILIFLMMMTVDNVYGHLGWEIFPKWLNKNPITKWINSSVNHNMHHRYFNSNYGLYFTFWDRIMGTTHPDYEKTYDEVVNREKPVEEVKQPVSKVARA